MGSAIGEGRGRRPEAGAPHTAGRRWDQVARQAGASQPVPKLCTSSGGISSGAHGGFAAPAEPDCSAESLARHLPAPGPALNPFGRRSRLTQACRAKDPALLPCVSSRRAGSACPERVQNNQPPSHRAGGSASGAVRTREMWPCRPGSAQPFHRAGGRAQFARRLFLFLRRARRIRRSGRIVAPSL